MTRDTGNHLHDSAALLMRESALLLTAADDLNERAVSDITLRLLTTMEGVKKLAGIDETAWKKAKATIPR